ncbi:MAG: IS66 family transposase [Verrucomicrobiota bacterium]
MKDGRIEIDNNLVENAIRATAIGKKNWLFIGEAEAGERSAILYTVIETADAGQSIPTATSATSSPACHTGLSGKSPKSQRQPGNLSHFNCRSRHNHHRCQTYLL